MNLQVFVNLVVGVRPLFFYVALAAWCRDEPWSAIEAGGDPELWQP